MIDITREEGATKGRYIARVADNDAVGELTYSKLGKDKVIADHTEVPESLRGRGIAQALVERLISDARAQGFTIVPLCPFVRSQYARHPEWSDVMEAW